MEIFFDLFVNHLEHCAKLVLLLSAFTHGNNYRPAICGNLQEVLRLSRIKNLHLKLPKCKAVLSSKLNGVIVLESVFFLEEIITYKRKLKINNAMLKVQIYS